MSDVEAELSRLKGIMLSPSSSLDQVKTAAAARKALLDAMADDAFIAIEKRTDDYRKLVDKLDDIVDAIKANRLTTVLDDVTRVLNEVKTAAGG